MPKRKNHKQFLQPILRKASLRWWARQEVIKRTNVSRGVYRCEMCEDEFPRKEIHVDHIDPIIPVDGSFTDWNTYIDRLFCLPEELQGLCIGCHASKTQIENEIRKKYKTLKKKLDSKKK